mmetsp:Transcript_20293/g.39782  ORF Transcript_20293/g.39782 Transcript_20293/m.39782 type:complete len:227 (+) Transcript_20293:145-825(+)
MEVRSSIPKVGTVEELKDLRKSEPLLGVYFFEDSGACHKIAPELEKLVTSKEYATVRFVRVDLLTSPEVKEKYEVESAPSFMFYKDDARVDHIAQGDLGAVRSALEKLTKRVRRITTLTEFDTIKTVHDRLIVHFFSVWAIECERLAELLEGLASDTYDPPVKFGRVDINECEALAREFQILTVPTFLLLRNGLVVDRFVGAPKGREAFDEAIKQLSKDLGPPKNT